MFHHLAQLPICFWQISIRPSRVGHSGTLEIQVNKAKSQLTWDTLYIVSDNYGGKGTDFVAPTVPGLLRVGGDEQQPPGDPRQLREGGARLHGAAAGELEVPVVRLRRPRIHEPTRARRPRERVAHGSEEGLRRTALPLEGE